jgi:hypothetical protein
MYEVDDAKVDAKKETEIKAPKREAKLFLLAIKAHVQIESNNASRKSD